MTPEKILLLSLALILFSCGKNDPTQTTLVSFSSSNPQATSATLSNGLIVYAISGNSSAENFFLTDESSLKEISLANGSYTFMAIGSVDATSNSALGGNTYYCGFGNGGNAVTLDGSPTTVNLSLLRQLVQRTRTS